MKKRSPPWKIAGEKEDVLFIFLLLELASARAHNDREYEIQESHLYFIVFFWSSISVFREAMRMDWLHFISTAKEEIKEKEKSENKEKTEK